MSKSVDTFLNRERPRLPVVLVVLLLVGLIAVVLVLKYLVGQTDDLRVQLPVLAIGGVIVLILLLAIVAAVFRDLGLANANQAMGLPDGSIRAVIALSLIVLFAILTVYLYDSLEYGVENSIDKLAYADALQLLKDRPTAKAIRVVERKDKDGFYDVI
jgi:hypothetical protein